MASNPQKTQDPTEAALSAIQEALNVRPPEGSPAAPAPEIAPPTPDLFPAEPAATESVSLRAPANDDREQVGQILQALRRRPSRAPYLAAGLAALAWVGASLAIAYTFKGELAGLPPKALYGVVAGIAFAIIVPVGFFYALAQMFSRSQDMRIVAESMAEVALRMAQPETLAREAVVSVGQAVRREVTAMGDGVERALARAAELEALVHNEVSAIERAYNDNEVRIRDLLNQLSNQREMMVNEGERVRGAIASVHLDLAHDITAVGDLVADKVSEAAQRVTRSLTEKGEVITVALGQAGDSMIDALSERGSTLLDKLESTSFQATNAIGTATEQLVGSLKFRSETVHEEFAELAGKLETTLNERLESVQKNFTENAGATMEAMAQHSREATQAINEAGSAIADSIVSRSTEATAQLRSSGETLVQQLGQRGTEVVTRIEQTGARITGAIAVRGEEVTNRLRDSGDLLAQEFGQHAADVVGRIEQTGARITDAVVNRSNTVADTFHDNAEALVKIIDNGSEAVRNMIGDRLHDFTAVFDGPAIELSNRIANDTANLGTLITSHLGEFEHTVKTYGGVLAERLDARTKEVAEAMRAYLDSFDERVTGRATELSDHLDKRLSRFEDLLGSRVADMAKTLSEGGKEMVGSLDSRIAEIGTTIDARAAEVAATLSARAESITDALGTRAESISQTLEVRYGRLEDLLVGRTENVASVIESRTKAAADTLIARFEQLSHAIQVNSSNAERNLSELAQTTSQTIRSSASEAERTLRGVGEEVSRGFIGEAERVATEVSARTKEIETVLSEQGGSLLASIGEKGQQFGHEITKATQQAMSVIEERGFGFSRSITENSEQVVRVITSAGQTAAETVNRTLAGLQDTAQKAIAKSQQTASATVNELMQTHNMLQSDTTSLFGRLREANLMLQEVLTGSHENMSALENTLMLRVSEFVSAMNEVTVSTSEATGRMETNIGGFREVTTQVLTDLGQLARTFEAHGQELAKAAALIDTSNRQTEANVAERRTELEALVATLDLRTEELAQRLKRFSGLIDETLDAAANRARDVARVVSEATGESARAIAEEYERIRAQSEEVARIMQQTSTDNARVIGEQFDRMREQADDVARAVQETSTEGVRAVAEQFDRIREQAEGERRRTAAAMRDIFEQGAGDTNSIFDEANARFAETLMGMKQMAAEMQTELATARQEVQRELEATRSELRRGVLELPQETAESTAQMRRVIVDQIEALAELNRIVARHGRSLDAVEPVRRVREEAPPLALAARSEAPVRSEQPVRSEAPRSEPPARAETPREPRPEPRPRDMSGFAPTSTRRGPEQLPPPPTGRGWLTDLLNRASREEDETPPRELNRERGRETSRPEAAGERRSAEERTPRHSIESLDSLSVDIARMIDHDAATDLWDRYKRGERNVFTRRLYTLQGQQAFDEIRKKYRADREFKQTVDRYIGEFERLLEEVARDDRSQVMTRTYLTSETGKVYTMLAHAAGRFD